MKPRHTLHAHALLAAVFLSAFSLQAFSLSLSAARQPTAPETATLPPTVPVVATPATPVKTTLPPHPWGVWIWGYNPLDTTYPPDIMAEIRGIPLTIRWQEIEPEQGRYTFDKPIGDQLKKCKQLGLYAHITLHIAYDTPRWVFDAGVPEVKVPQRISPNKKVQNLSFPYYFDERFQKILRATVKALGDYLAALPPDIKSRLVYIQMAEGSTGDPGPYKGEPTDKKYAIDRDTWSVYRRAIWDYYLSVFQRPDGTLALPFLVGSDVELEGDMNWLLAHTDNFGIKQGMFSHGFLTGDATDRLAHWETFRAKARAAGHTVFSRGEQDNAWATFAWSTRNPAAAFYWTMLFALHNKLDIWNVPIEALATQPIVETLRFFNRYAGHDDDPAAAPGAFCALRRGLNAADTKTFPESKYGQAKRPNTERYMAIQKDYARYGALEEDVEKAMGAGMRNRQADGYNDVGWNILPGNFERFLTQLRPEETSLALWHVESAKSANTPYGLFARRFDAASGRVAMTFRLADKFFATPAAKVAGASSSQAREQDAPATIRVAYLDKGPGSWELVYATASGEKIAKRVTNTDTNEWRDLTLTLTDAVWTHRLPGGGDLMLRHVSGEDTIFHMIELTRMTRQ